MEMEMFAWSCHRRLSTSFGSNCNLGFFHARAQDVDWGSDHSYDELGLDDFLDLFRIHVKVVELVQKNKKQVLGIKTSAIQPGALQARVNVHMHCKFHMFFYDLPGVPPGSWGH